MRRWLALLVIAICACTEHGSGGGMVCEGITFVPDPQPPASVAACTNEVAGDPNVLYATCDEGLPSLVDCIAPNRSGVCFDGRRTTLCASDADCISGFKCSESFFGGGLKTCERECDVDLDCIRCNLFCDTSRSVCSELIAMPDRG